MILIDRFHKFEFAYNIQTSTSGMNELNWKILKYIFFSINDTRADNFHTPYLEWIKF